MLDVTMDVLSAVKSFQLEPDQRWDRFVKWIRLNTNDWSVRAIHISPEPEDVNFQERHAMMRGIAIVLATMMNMFDNIDDVIAQQKRIDAEAERLARENEEAQQVASDAMS